MRHLIDNSLVDEPKKPTNHIPMPNLFDELVDQYKLEKHLTPTGVTDLYLAYDVDENRSAAVEILLPYLAQNRTYSQRFIEKQRKVAQIKHRNLAQVLQVGITPFNNRPYFAREYVESYPLKERLSQLAQQDDPVHTVYALKLVRQIAEALALAERLDIFHYDLQPKKIRLKMDGTVVITDLGIPRLKNIIPNGHELDQDVNYWSPEQIQGKSIDARSHVYSLGAILYELLTAIQPALPDSARQSKKRSSGRISLEKVRPDLSSETYRLISKAMRGPVWSRFQNSGEFIVAVDEAIKAEEFLLGTGEKERRRSFRGMGLKIGIPLLLLLVATVAGLFLLRGSDNDDGAAVVGVQLSATPIAAINVPPTATFTPSPTETAVSVSTNISGIEPLSGQQFTQEEIVPFSWVWETPLQEDQRFVIEVTSAMQTFIIDELSQSRSGAIYLSQRPASLFIDGPGIYQWQIKLLSSDSDDLVTQSEVRDLIILAPATETAEPTVMATESASSTPTVTPTALPQVRVIVASASLREGPGTNYGIVTFLEAGDVVTVIAINREEGNWYNVQTEDGLFGWLSISVSEAVDGTETAVTAVPTAATIPASPIPTSTPTPTPTLTPSPPPPSNGGGPDPTQGPPPTLTPPPPP